MRYTVLGRRGLNGDRGFATGLLYAMQNMFCLLCQIYQVKLRNNILGVVRNMLNWQISIFTQRKVPAIGDGADN